MVNNYQELIVTSIGETGFLQVVIVLASKCGTAVVAYALVMMSFFMAEPKWKQFGPLANQTGVNSSVYHYRCPLLANTTVTFEGGMHTIVNEWQLICSRKWVIQLIVTAQMIGVMVGVIVNGQIGQNLGRRKVMLINLSSLMLFMILLGCSVSWHMMAVCLFLVGCACGAYLVIANVYYIEFIGTSWRTVLSCIPAWPVGVVLLGGGIKLFANWRYSCFLGAGATFPVIVALWFCPESIRWLFIRGHFDEGKKVIKLTAKRNGRNEPDLMFIDGMLEELVQKEREEMSSYNYLTLLKLKDTRTKVMIFGPIWMSMAITYYVVMFGVGRLHGDISLNMFLMGLVQCFGVAGVWLLSKCFGRKYASCLLLSLSGVTCLASTIVYLTASQSTFEKVQQWLAITSMFWMASAWGSVSLHTVELFPTVLRSIAMATVNIFARIGGLIAPSVASVVWVSPHLPFTICAVLSFLSAGLYLPLDDTYKCELDDYLQDSQSPGEKTKEMDVEM